jgi:hypothetical protein
MISTLAALAEDEQITAYVNSLAAGTTGTGNSHLAMGLRALGGLLAGGIYNEQKLEAIRKDLSASAKLQDRAAFEFFDVLLGKRNLQEFSRLRAMANNHQDELIRLNQRILQQEEALAQARQRAEQAESRAMSLQKELSRR